jgi:hypothetical protein
MTQSLSRLKPVDQLRILNKSAKAVFFCPEE